MSDETGAPAGSDAAPAITPLPADAPETFSSPREAFNYFSELKQKKSAESADPEATADPELAQANSDPEMAPAEATEEIDPENNLPTIDPPRSWTKEEKEEFATYPREAQEKIARREQDREAAFRRSQNEAADVRKAAEAARAQADQARQQYESKLAGTVKVMEDSLHAEFGDIQSLQDVRKLQAEDPFRFQAWQVRQMELTAAKSEQLAAEQRQSQERQSRRTAYEDQQNKLLFELVPEMADPKKASELRERAVNMLIDDLGLKNDQLSRWMADDTGHEILSNAGIQKLIADGLKYREIQAAPKAVAAKSLPPVQRPGTSKPAGSAVSERIQALTRQLNETGSLKVAQQLRALQSQRRTS